nr:MAG TPA: hypothetical protein [Inoviridae sp.]
MVNSKGRAANKRNFFHGLGLRMWGANMALILITHQYVHIFIKPKPNRAIFIFSIRPSENKYYSDGLIYYALSQGHF